MSQDPFENLTPRRALLSSRILWAALLGGQVVFIGILAALQRSRNAPPANVETVNLLFYIVIAMVLVCVPIGYFVRNQMYKRHWEGEVITPQGYLQGNLILWAMCEGPSLFGLVLVMLAGEFWPWIAPSAAAIAVQLINWPDGRAMLAPGQTMNDLDRPL